MSLAAAIVSFDSAGADTPPTARECGLHQRTPRRIGRRFCQHRLPDRTAASLAAVLLGGEPQEIARLDLVGVHRTRALELGLGLAGDDAAGGCRQRLAEIGAALGTVAAIGDRVAPGPDRIVVAAEPRKHRRQHGPAAAVGRIVLQMRLDLGNQIVERLGGIGRTRARGKRKIAELRRSQRQINRDRRQRQADQRDDGGDAAQPVLACAGVRVAGRRRPAGGG